MPTRNEVETVVQRRLAGFLRRAKMTTAPHEDNEHLADPIGWALRRLGYAPASLATITDDDLAGLVAGHIDALLDLAELRAIESMITNLDNVSTQTGPVRSEWDNLRKDLLAYWQVRRPLVAAMWGHLLAIPLDEPVKMVRMRAL